MTHRKNTIFATLAAATSLFLGILVTGNGSADSSAVDYTKMSPEELAEYLIFEANGFDLEQEVQEGGPSRQRLVQDDHQKACSAHARSGSQMDGETAGKVTEMARNSILYPEGGIKLGDWQKGEVVARTGSGFRLGRKFDDHAKRAPGGNCYACHQLDPEEISFGTIGPSLTGYGKQRGTSEEILKYTYDVIYNANNTFPCTNMPRFGSNGFLTREQIADTMAYLMDPESPVNK